MKILSGRKILITFFAYAFWMIFDSSVQAQRSWIATFHVINTDTQQSVANVFNKQTFNVDLATLKHINFSSTTYPAKVDYVRYTIKFPNGGIWSTDATDAPNYSIGRVNGQFDAWAPPQLGNYEIDITPSLRGTLPATAIVYLHIINSNQGSPGTPNSVPSSNCSASGINYSAPHMYYVSAGAGNNSNSGLSSNCAFATIQRAADLAVAGSTINIAGGVYYESVHPQNSGSSQAPIVFQSLNGAQVLVSANVPLSGAWNFEGDNLYSHNLPVDLGRGNNEVFVGQAFNQVAIPEARWPYGGSDLSFPGWRQASSASWGRISDSVLPSASWNQSTIVYLDGSYDVAVTGVVNDSSRSGSVGYYQAPEGPDPATKYALVGSDAALLPNPGSTQSNPGWYVANGKIYLRMADHSNPSSQHIEMKQRSLVFDLSSNSYTTIQKLNTIGGGITTGRNSTGIIIDSIKASYVSHFTMLPSTGWDPTPALNTGIVLNGWGNTLSNSEVAYSAGSGVGLQGSWNQVVGNRIHDVDYAGLDASNIYVNGSNHTIHGNTLYNSARSIIVHRNSQTLTITDNDMYYGGLQLSDYGATYSFNTDCKNTEIAFNYVHDMMPDKNGWAGGLFLDNGTENASVHDNLVWNINLPVKVNPVISNRHTIASYGIQIYNNTLLYRPGLNAMSVASESGTFAGDINVHDNIMVSSSWMWHLGHLNYWSNYFLSYTPNVPSNYRSMNLHSWNPMGLSLPRPQ